ncbi:MAG: methionine sulfoxide reductase heme-binding subunit [Gaiellaceae bacterium]|jgi:DMSO/TMAO reductase YedYZ heme-binding membrane subunit|nr:methionine sulfoxide reductase heme-binding subunit [Gaiellaceae bacterium]
MWYATRGTGAVALVLLTLSILLGVTMSTRWRSTRWPRFLVNGLHRNVTLLAFTFVVVHVLTTIADGYAPVGFLDAVVPFHSAYRPVWLGLGAIAFDLLVALIATSLLRARIGFKTWRAVHWLAYASWPVALVHAFGTGTDAGTLWLQLLGVACTGTVVAAVLWRVATARGGAPLVRAGSVFAAFAIPIGVFVWAQGGPWRPGWAARAGTPTSLQASVKTAPVGRSSLASAVPSLPSGTFTASFNGKITQSQSNDGYVVVTIDATVRGGFAGRLHLAIRGAPLQGGGVQMVDSVFALLPTGAPSWSSGSIASLSGTQIAADVRTPDGRTVHLAVTLTLDSVSNGVTGTLRGTSSSQVSG